MPKIQSGDLEYSLLTVVSWKQCWERRNLEALSSGDPTYWPSDTRKKTDVIDFFVARLVHRHQCDIHTVADLSSDHIPICATFSLQASAKLLQTPLVNRYTDWDLYRQYLEPVTQHHLPIQTAADLESIVALFTGALQEAANRSTPTLSSSPTNIVSSNFSETCHARRRARKRWQLTRSPEDLRELRRCNNRVRQELRKSRNESFASFLSELSPSPDKNYSLWKSTRKFRRAPVQPLPPLLVNNRWIRDDVEKVELYANHLQTVFTPHSSLSSPEPIPEHEQRSPKCIFFSPKEVAATLDQLNVKKSPGPDRITGRMLRVTTHQHSVADTDIQCLSLIHISEPTRPY